MKDALRHYARVGLLIRNPLLEAQIATARGAKPTSVVKLQQMLAEATETILVNEQRQRRVLELTYFKPAPKREAVAEAGLPFGTYRHHLSSAVACLSEWLWHK